MRHRFASALAWAALGGVALAQGASVSVGPDGTLRGGVSVPGAPPMSVQAGNGQVTTTGPAPQPPRSTHPNPYAGPGRSVTVTSPDGRSSSSVSVTGDNAAVAGSGSPGSRVYVTPPRAAKARVCPRGASRAYRMRTGCRLARAARLR